MAVNPMLVGGIGVGVTAAAVTGGLYAGGVIGGSVDSKGDTNGLGKTARKEDWEDGMPSGWHSLSEDNGYSTSGNGYENKYNAKYKKYFVGVTNKNGGDTNAIDAWWDWVHEKRLQKDKATLKDKFSTVDKAKGTESTSLKTVCQAAYKEELSNGSGDSKKILTSNPTTKDTDKFWEENIWKYCSPAGAKIKTVKEAADANKNPYGNESTKYGKGKETELVSVTGNNWFWSEREKDLTNHTFTDANSNSEFKKLKDKAQKDPKVDTVREVCRKAYQADIPSDETGAYTKAEVGKFCSLSGTTIS